MKRNQHETDEQFLERVARVRGALEERFWRQASELKVEVERLQPATAADKLRVKSAKTSLWRANLYYLDEDLERALESQAKVASIVLRMKGKTAGK